MSIVGIIRGGKALALMAFLLPWMAVSCERREIAQANGWGLATATARLPEQMSNSAPFDQPLFLITALLALIAGIAGLWFSFGREPDRVLARTTLTSAIAALCVAASPVVANAMLDAELQSHGADGRVLRAVNIDLLYGWWLSLAGFACAAIVGYLARRGQLPSFQMPAMPQMAPSAPVAGETAPAPGAAAQRDAVSTHTFAAPALGAALSPTWALPALLALLVGLMSAQLAIANATNFDRFRAVTGLSAETGADAEMTAWATEVGWLRLGVAALALFAGLFLRRASPLLIAATVAIGTAALIAAQFAPNLLILTVCCALPYAAFILLRPLASALVAQHAPAAKWATGVGIVLAGSVAVTIGLQRWALTPNDDGAALATTAPLVPTILLAVFTILSIVGLLAYARRNLAQPPEEAAPNGAGAPGRILGDATGLHLIIGAIVLAFSYRITTDIFFVQAWRTMLDAGLTDTEIDRQMSGRILPWAPVVGYLVGGLLSDALLERSRRAPYWIAAAATALGALGLFFVAASQESATTSFFILACLAAPLAPATAALLRGARASAHVGVAALLALATALAFSPLSGMAQAALSQVASIGLTSEQQAGQGAGMQLRLLLALIGMWAAAHFWFAGYALHEPNARPRLPWLSLAVGAMALIGAGGWIGWQHRAVLGVFNSPAPLEAPTAAPEPAAPAPEAASETTTEHFADGSTRTYEADELRPGHPLFDIEMRADCAVYYRGALVQPAAPDDPTESGRCSYLPRVHRSPSGRWIAVHAPLDDYGYIQLAVIDTAAQAVALPAREVSPRARLFPLNAWSADENLLLMTQLAFTGPTINDLYQLTLEVPCVFNIAAAALRCGDEGRLAGAVQTAALRASPLARCLPDRTCNLAMAIRNVRPEADGFAITGVVQLKNADADSYATESFESGVDIVWFAFSARASDAANVQDLTLQVVHP